MMGSPEALQTIVLTEEDGIMTMVSSLLYGSQAERDAAIATGMEEGASQTYDRLAESSSTYLEPARAARDQPPRRASPNSTLRRVPPFRRLHAPNPIIDTSATWLRRP